MELLLILSAMLSALTGAFTGAREPEARLQQAEAAIAAEAAVAVAQAQAPLRREALPVAPLPRIAAVPLPDVAVVLPAPLEAVRLIE